MQQFTDIIHKEMTRKEFLATIGLGIVSVMGFGTVLKLLTGKNTHSKSSSGGYGSSPYGR